MDALDAVEAVLRDERAPLHYREITNRILKRRLWETSGKTPDATVNARLAVDIQERGPKSRFRRTAPGMFALSELASGGGIAAGGAPAVAARERPAPRSGSASPAIPTFDAFMKPTLEALEHLGGSASNDELQEEVATRMKLTAEQLAVVHAPDKSSQTEVAYRMGWARTYLKKAGYLENSARGVWALVRPEVAATLDPARVVADVRSQYGRGSEGAAADGGCAPLAATGVDAGAPQVSPADTAPGPELAIDDAEEWRGALMRTLLAMPAPAFERLCQRVLREVGFVEVTVTGRSGDGGIDGKGILRMQTVLSIHMIFQCKRYSGSVGAGEVRDFRGAMVGRTDKGLLITTGTFSKQAQQEATRDGAPQIDLVDGERLLDLLKELRLGVTSEMVERVSVNREWFGNI